jgi:hypothetical protein
METLFRPLGTLFSTAVIVSTLIASPVIAQEEGTAGVAAQATEALTGPVDSMKGMFSSLQSDTLTPLITQAQEFLPRLGAALVILILGWIVACIVAFAVRMAIRKTGLNALLGKYFPAVQGRAPDAAGPIAKIFFYIIMLFVLIAVFQALQLDMITQPINAFLQQVFEYAPRFIGAGVLAVVAWVVARIVKTVSYNGLTAADVDTKLMSFTRSEGEAATDTGSIPLSKTISETGYWLVFLLFLPAILGALNMPGIMEPIQGMISKAMDYLPNMIAAAVILVVGWFVAKIVKQIVTNLLAAAGADRFTEQAGISLGTSLSDLAGTICHALILLPVLVASLNALSIDAVTQPASAMLDKITGSIPGIFGGVVVIGIALFVGKIVSELVTNVLSGLGTDELPSKLGLGIFESSGSKSLSALVGKLVLIATVLFAAMQALPMMGLAALGTQMEDFIGLAMNVLLGVVLFGLGMYLANIAAEAIKSSGMRNSDVLATIARWSICILAGTMALGRSGLAPTSIINLAFGLTLGAIAVAAAISFGWGGRDAAKRVLDKYVG